MEARRNKGKIWLFNVVFVIVCLGIFLLLWNAPPETTPRLPHDDNHQPFFAMGKKEAEKFCENCHQPDGIRPLPETHPPTYRCLLCHKRDF